MMVLVLGSSSFPWSQVFDALDAVARKHGSVVIASPLATYPEVAAGVWSMERGVEVGLPDGRRPDAVVAFGAVEDGSWPSGVPVWRVVEKGQQEGRAA